MLARHYIGESWKHGLLIIGALIVLIPFYMMVSMSLKSQKEIQSISGGLVGAQEIQTFPVCTKHGYTILKRYAQCDLINTISGLHSKKPQFQGI